MKDDERMALEVRDEDREAAMKYRKHMEGVRQSFWKAFREDVLKKALEESSPDAGRLEGLLDAPEGDNPLEEAGKRLEPLFLAYLMPAPEKAAGMTEDDWREMAREFDSVLDLTSFTPDDIIGGMDQDRHSERELEYIRDKVFTDNADGLEGVLRFALFRVRESLEAAMDMTLPYLKLFIPDSVNWLLMQMFEIFADNQLRLTIEDIKAFRPELSALLDENASRIIRKTAEDYNAMREKDKEENLLETERQREEYGEKLEELEIVISGKDQRIDELEKETILLKGSIPDDEWFMYRALVDEGWLAENTKYPGCEQEFIATKWKVRGAKDDFGFCNAVREIAKKYRNKVSNAHVLSKEEIQRHILSPQGKRITDINYYAHFKTA